MPPPRGSFNPIEGPGDFDVTQTVHSDTYAAIDPTKADLSGRAVLIVGGSRGIGKEVMLSFARAGVSQLVVGARSNVSALSREVGLVAKESGKEPPQFLPVILDILNRQSIEHAASTIKADFGRLDIVVIVAGIFGKTAKVAESDPDEWWSTFEVNLRGPYLIYRTFLPLLVETKSGLKTICSLASVGAWIVNPTLSAYQSSKTALVRLANFVAAEYGDEGIVSFSVHPGNVLTGIFGSAGPPKGFEHIICDTARLPADTIVYLTKEQNTWLNGRYINCTWDMSELEAERDNIVNGDKFKATLRI